MNVLDRAAIEAAIPHRDPFLFVTSVEDSGEDFLTSSWHVPADGAWFRGHYPGEPVLPGVLISEHCFQSAALLISQRLNGFDPADGIPVLTKIEGARFKRIVRPDETLETRIDLRETLGPAYYLSAHVRCAGQTVLRMRFVLTATEAAGNHGGGDPGPGQESDA